MRTPNPRTGRLVPEPQWTGVVRLCPDELAKPLRRKKPTVVFVCDMGDLFHEKVPFEFIAAVFGVMAATPHITYLLLTKRAQRMAEFYAWVKREALKEPSGIIGGAPGVSEAAFCALLATQSIGLTTPVFSDACDQEWPLSNCWPGCTAEDQKHFDERAPYLLTVPTHEKAGKWLSLEPQLGPIDATDLVLHEPQSEHDPRVSVDVLTGLVSGPCEYRPEWQIRLVVQGCESGPGARPFDIEWAVSMHEQVQAANASPDYARSGVSYYLKQMPSRCNASGRLVPGGKLDKEPQLYGRMWRDLPWQTT
jgi:protein gp37